MADESGSSPPIMRRARRRQIILSSDINNDLRDGPDTLPPSDPFSEMDEYKDMPGLNEIQCSDGEEEEEEGHAGMPALQKVPENELTDDDEDSDWEDDEDTPKKITPTASASSPLSQAPDTPPKKIIEAQLRFFPSFSSPLSPVPSSPPTGLAMLSSSPMYTPRVERKITLERIQRARFETTQRNKAALRSKEEAEEATEKQRMTKEQEKRNSYFDRVLSGLQNRNYTLADLVEYVFNPTTRFTSGFDWRWRGFFSQKAAVKNIFSYWSTSQTNKTTRALLWEWAYQLVKRTISKESKEITKSGLLNKTKKTVNEAFFLGYSLTGLSKTLRGLAPAAFGIFDAFSSTKRQMKDPSKGFLKKRDVLSGSAAIALLNGASQNNSYAQAVHSTYLMATGAQRQHFSILSGFRLTMGYTSVISRGTKLKEVTKDATASDDDTSNEIDGVDPPEPALPGRHARKNKKRRDTKKAKKKRIRSPGTLSLLSDACRATARAIASTGLFLVMYDNVNMMVRVAEQILGRKNTQENGTCATEVPLHDTKLEALLTADLDEFIANARPLTIETLELTDAEASFFRKNMIHTILRILVRYGGEGFTRWNEDLNESQPVSADKITLHQSSIHPLPAMEIDENSIKGNIEVIEAINKELGLDEKDPNYVKYVKIIAGDQLTIARQRSILQLRLGHESGAQAWKHFVLMPGLFHAKIADCHGVLATHFGKPGAGKRSPGSLGFHNTVMDRLPITLTSLPPFRTCRDLIMVSLYARILHCLLLVSETASLEEYAGQCDSWAMLSSHAEQIYDRFANADIVQELRECRVPEERQRDAELAAKAKGAKKSADPNQPALKKEHPPHVRKGDMVFENALLFIRDALLTREFADAIKAGDSGRVVLVLKLFAFTYRGNGRTKYAHEMLHVLHNLVNVWSDDLRHVILHNWLLNPSGKINAFVEVDLVQEHLNLWIKRIYKADGDAHSWDWLALVSPCVDVLRRLATSINEDLGARQGDKHTIPDLSKDIDSLMASLCEHEVYVLKEGRVLDDDEMPVPDVLSAGAASLTHGISSNPIDEFNELFDQLRQRRTLIPISELLQYQSEATSSDPAASPPASPSPLISSRLASPARSDDFPESILFQAGDHLTVESLGQDESPDLTSPTSTPPASDDEEDAADADVDEDLFAQSPTLTRLEAEDVDLDMDDDWLLDGGYGSGSDYDEDGSDDELSGSESD
ncbi:hypothetical protein C8J57DRAFT_1572916 [Mycena rebaudengoi]|nr:hypothetical protein C8J57DRAFT_1572916 [Mycena rebaudengoi]